MSVLTPPPVSSTYFFIVNHIFLPLVCPTIFLFDAKPHRLCVVQRLYPQSIRV